ncbi:hypothetical protein GQ53DRAFT_784348 [Thozetella sp. PMI_491]|nr:hypothetical protein GQ53DRAFT_784348 [Thozetella sp. PMI_491]
MASSDGESRSASPVPLAPGGSPTLPDTTLPAASAAADGSSSKKRTASTSEPGGAPKVTKRRAARACVSCRARKVRCDVVEGAPCGNCRWDNVTCVVQESRRRKKNIFATPAIAGQDTAPAFAEALSSAASTTPNPVAISSAEPRKASINSIDAAPTDPALVSSEDGHVPHLICKHAPGPTSTSSLLSDHEISSFLPLTDQRTAGYQADAAALLAKLGDANDRLPWSNAAFSQAARTGLLGDLHSIGADLRTAQFLSSLEEPDGFSQLPLFIKPLPFKIVAEDVKYLHAKGALSLPTLELQNALLKAYVEYVHPYMPLLELHDFLSTVHHTDGLAGQISLFLYQAVMFAATAFVDLKHLRDAGFATRKAARKTFFQRTRLLYDFDYESDRLVLVQGLLLMTYWYETPDDQKDTWHWMGVAISLAHTIGLHRNPANTNMVPRKQKLWKRIWWSCFMRDRLIALGMRRPTRIKDEDYDVPMLEEGDFEIEALPEENQLLSTDCKTIRDIAIQKELAVLCIEKARLCICISHMLKVQYSVLNRDNIRPENTTSSTMMLFPNKTLDNVESVRMVDLELMTWFASLPQSCQYRPLVPQDVKDGRSTLAVQRNLLHMVYQTTISALHRPQFLPASPLHTPTASRQVQEMSRVRVRDAANHITQMAAELHHLRLERYLPTTGVTVILPAMIIHLLDMKNPVPEARAKATRGFRQCMRVMEKLREIYAAADFATGFLDAALRKVAIDMESIAAQQQAQPGRSLNGVLAPGLNLGVPAEAPVALEKLSTPPPENAPYLNKTEVKLYHQNRTYMPKDSNGNPAVIRGPTPPQTDRETDSVSITTPSATGSLEESPADLAGQDEFDWNAISGPNLDFDQWLQFPAEGVNNSDESFMGMFGSGVEQQESSAAQGSGMEWIETSSQHTKEASSIGATA